MKLYVLLVLVTWQPADAQHSPYMDMMGREIKALSAEQVEGYLRGDGMSLALAAELNGYPGPKHVLEMADSLTLSEAQLQATRSVFNSMSTTAQLVGVELVAIERVTDSLFANGTMREMKLSDLMGRVGQLQGDLRLTHLRAHLAMMKILSQHQVMIYRRVRGYAEHDMHGAVGATHESPLTARPD